jgi:hypothetical protein
MQIGILSRILKYNEQLNLKVPPLKLTMLKAIIKKQKHNRRQRKQYK